MAGRREEEGRSGFSGLRNFSGTGVADSPAQRFLPGSLVKVFERTNGTVLKETGKGSPGDVSD